MSTTRLRVKSRKDWPTEHPMDMPGYASAPEDEMWLTVLLPPKQGQHPFDCGAPFIWRVSDEDVRAYGLDGNRYVCVHQVWAD